MSYPQITLIQSDYAQITQNKTGDLAMVYKPLQNLIKDTTLGDFTTERLSFDRHSYQDMLITDEFDGSTNIIINDDTNKPRLVNSGFSVQEDNTFLIPEHYTNTVDNIYVNDVLDQDTQLFKLYRSIPELEFQGLSDGGSFQCGSYVFYFRLSDSHGNMSNIIQHSSPVQVYIGQAGSYKVRMGMQDEEAGKIIGFTLTGLDSGFDYVRVFYERTSTGNDMASSTLFYMVDQNYPITDGTCTITLTGEENTIQTSLADLKNEYADIASCKTHAIVDNTLFMANTSGYVHDYGALQRMAWSIFAEQGTDYIELPSTKADGEAYGYYNANNVYSKVGYWPDEYYRFGIIFIYNSNQLSPVFNIQGYDLNKAPSTMSGLKDLLWAFNGQKYDFHDSEPSNYIFNDSIMSNSKGVVRLKPQDGTAAGAESEVTFIKFNIEGLNAYIHESQDLTDDQRDNYRISGSSYDVPKFLEKHHGIKGFFFVRQKRIPTIIAQGMVVGVTKKDFGSLPALKNTVWSTKSFLSWDRLVLKEGSTVTIPDDNIECNGLLVPDAELQEATFNQFFTSQEYALSKEGSLSFGVDVASNWWEFQTYKQSLGSPVVSKLTAVPKDTKVVTNGEDYFSTIAGSAEEAFKTEDVCYKWDTTAPQYLTQSNKLVRGKWGYFVGMSYKGFKFGDVVNIRPVGFAKDPDAQNMLEFQSRFASFDRYSPISPRFNISKLDTSTHVNCYNGDCFPSMFTHRMMTNFIDPELPTNTKIIDPGCWAKNYAVRCTAEIITGTHSNLTGDSAGFYVPSPVSKTSTIVSLVFGILTGNLGIVIKSAADLANKSYEERPKQEQFANEIAQAFEVYLGKPKKGDEDKKPDETGGEGDWVTNGGYSENYGSGEEDTVYAGLVQAMREGKIKKVVPAEQEQNASGFNLKALFKSDDKWELHGLAQINRADVNAVSFGQWVTFPIKSSMNLALRDVDFNQITEEAKFNKKRGFYPLEPMDIYNRVPESNVINGAAKKTVHKNNYTVFKTVPYVKQEYFNRIYWSKPNISESFLNSFRLVYSDQYKEYNKEFGDITKIVPIGNSLLVVFDHGMGVLPVDRTIKTEAEASPYLASRNVLPSQVTTLSKDFGSMWKNSIIKTPKGLVYGVDTVGKKIWRTQGSELEFISDHYVTKFLNENIKLSEFDYKSYQGHIDVKTHYNNFKNDVIFTFVKDIPTYANPDSVKEEEIRKYMKQMWGANKAFFVYFGEYKPGTTSGSGTLSVIYGPPTTIRKSGVKVPQDDTICDKYISHTVVKDYDADGNYIGSHSELGYRNGETIILSDEYEEKIIEIQSGKAYINDLFTGVWLDVESWEPGPVWSLCYNETLQKWITFYDWYPVESCNVDNIFFSFDQEAIDSIFDNAAKCWYPTIPIDGVISSKYFVDKTFADRIKQYRFAAGDSLSISESTPTELQLDIVQKPTFLSLYYKGSTPPSIDLTRPAPGTITPIITYPVLDDWQFVVYQLTTGTLTRVEASTYITDTSNWVVNFVSDTDLFEVKVFNLPRNLSLSDYLKEQRSELLHLQYYELRDYNPNRLYLWKHGQAGLYDNQGEIKPTNWYGKQREFNFEFVVNDTPMRQKIFNNLKIISNKTQPNKFEYEIVGEGYEWWQYKPVVHWANQKVKEGIFPTLYSAYAYILRNNTSVIRSTYPDFPITDLEYRDQLKNNPYVYRKLPYLKIELTDRQGRADRSYHLTDAWSPIKPVRDVLPRVYDYTFNTNETSIKYDKQLNEYRLHDEQLGNNMWKYGRVRGNMQYLEDMWNIEIRPINFMWIYRRVSEDDLLKINKTSSFILDDFHKSVCEFQMSVSDDSEVLITEELEGQEPIQTIYPIESNKTISIRYDRTYQNSKIAVTFIPQTEAEFEIPDNKADNIYLYHLLQSRTETRHRDKYIKVKVRYSGENLALIQQIYTIFDESYA